MQERFIFMQQLRLDMERSLSVRDIPDVGEPRQIESSQTGQNQHL